ncbi:beta-ketoacyl-[acyl-carrier-protein] synthase family protein [Nocardioides zeae]|uniref:3-oxoacyl-[acyl-carrier-protein] synthase II n=1 Tax=Nocardioides zeae TaxID=1457234 RepID=A0AAJ1TXF3_9ACTN|nr:beta-ketoacyl-[acyl-carrier-protein] synthase family protein [Nocardioides zeae]MDQ1104110.1 3-oxoacyl-[acyl-carrier-protein] synthase II [Nocardioides zeae]
MADHTMHEDPVVVTGIGTVLPGTHDVGDLWSHVSNGRSQVSRLDRFDAAAAGLPVHAAAQVRDFDHRSYLPALKDEHAAKYSREILVAMSAIASALADAGLQRGDVPGERVSIVQSSSRGPLAWWASAMDPGAGGAPYGDSGAMFRGLAGCPASLAAIYLGAQGLVTTISSACVGGHHAVGIALDELRSGRADVVLAGGHEFPVLAEVARCYLAFGPGVLSSESEDPTRAVRPYSADREGFALGEGATTLCLERESSARARGARIYARVLSHAPANEAAHGTSMDLTGKVTASVMGRALAAADRDRDQVGLVVGHGTATRYNDLAESRALRALFVGRDDADLPPHTSNKPIYGHTFGMAGVINVAATALALHHQTLTPTANLVAPDPECDTDHVAGGPRRAAIDVALSLSFAFGSQTSVMAMERA